MICSNDSCHIDDFIILNLSLFFQNAFWYSVGWNIFFFIPSIIFSLLLVSLYRKIEPFSDKPTFDDP